MNDDLNQKEEISNSLFSRFNRESFWKLKTKGQVHYHKGNEIASYSLYNPTYYMSKGAEELLVSRGFDLNKTHTRSSIHHIRENERKGKKLTTFEHAVPTVVQFDLVKDIRNQKGEVPYEDLMNILNTCGVVVIMTQEENKLLEKGKLRSSMPVGCNPMENPFARYEQVGIELSDKVINVKGAMMR